MQRTDGINCPYCGRWFSRVCDYKRHDIYSIVSCVTKIKIAENDKIHRGILKQEYLEANPTKQVANARRRREYYYRHRERELERLKDFYNNNKDKYRERYIKNKDKVKEYYQANKEKILEKQRAYRKSKKTNTTSYGNDNK